MSIIAGSLAISPLAAHADSPTNTPSTSQTNIITENNNTIKNLPVNKLDKPQEFGRETNNGYCIKVRKLSRGSDGVLSFGWNVTTPTGETYYLADRLKLAGSMQPTPNCSINLFADSNNRIVGWSAF